jgi:two-component system, NarL family, captular synthesis response regulator RcsB
MITTSIVKRTHTVLIADDHPIVARALLETIEKDSAFEVVGTAMNPFQLFEILRNKTPDILITDFSMPGVRNGDGFPMVDRIISAHPSLRLVIITGVTGTPTLRALATGPAHGVLTKGDTADELLVALHSVIRVGFYRSSILEKILSRAESRGESSRTISSKEAEVIRLFVGGMSVMEIAALLRKSIKTISNQKWAAMRKLGCESDTQLYELYQYGGINEVSKQNNGNII